MSKKLEVFFKIDPEIYDKETKTFGDNPPSDYNSGGDSYSAHTNEWRSGVHRISETQYQERMESENDLIQAENCVGSTEFVSDSARVWYAKKDGLYFTCAGKEQEAIDAFKRHFKTRFQ